MPRVETLPPSAGLLDTPVRLTIGLLIPSSNTGAEPDFYRMAPPGVTTHTARMFAADSTLEGMRRMAEDVDAAARLLTTAEVGVIAYGCTTGSMLFGAAYDRALSERLSAIAGAPAVTVSTAVLEAFQALGVGKVAVGTPYVDELNRAVRSFLEDNGISVVRLRGLEISDNTVVGRLLPSAAYELGLEVDCPEAEAVFLSCTNFRASEAAEALEQTLGKPVVTGNQATLWAALRRGGVAEAVPGFGSLLRL